jgi:hypothetical protein
MLAHHHDLGITANQRFRLASLMSLAAADADLPADRKFRAALVGYLKWGARLAMYNSQPCADVQQAPGAPLGLGCRLALNGAASVVRGPVASPTFAPLHHMPAPRIIWRSTDTTASTAIADRTRTI